MTTSELECAILVYLGADGKGGVYPVGMDDRLKRKYGWRAEDVLGDVKDTLSILREYKPDSADTLEAASNKVEVDLNRRLPQFSDLLVKAMVNYWSYGWR